jgi:hypothetical protein
MSFKLSYFLSLNLKKNHKKVPKAMEHLQNICKKHSFFINIHYFLLVIVLKFLEENRKNTQISVPK